MTKVRLAAYSPSGLVTAEKIAEILEKPLVLTINFNN